MAKHVRVELTNHWAWITASDKIKRKLDSHWSYYKPGYYHTDAYRRYLYNRLRLRTEGEDESLAQGWDGKVHFLKGNVVPAGLFRSTYRDVAEKEGIVFDIYYSLPHVPTLLAGLPLAPEQYSYQDQCVDKMVGALHRGGGIILSATGSGKTATFARFASRVPLTMLFVVDQLELLDQAKNEIEKWLKEKVGYVGDSIFDPQRITVGTRQTLSKHLKDKRFLAWYNKIEVVIIDELHEQMNSSNFGILERIKPVARYGLTATLQLKKKNVRMKANAFAGPILFHFPLQEGVERGVLTKGRVIQLLFEPLDVADIDYQQYVLDQVVKNEVKLRAASAIINLLVSSDKCVVALVERVAHVEQLSSLLPVPHRLAYGKIKKDIRFESKEKFEAGEINCILANKVFKKGLDIKRVDVMIDAAEMKSKNDALQKYGRGVRLHPDKDELLYIDFGTQGKCRFAKAAASRARALKAEGIPLTKVKVRTVSEAVKAVRKYIYVNNHVR